MNQEGGWGSNLETCLTSAAKWALNLERLDSVTPWRHKICFETRREGQNFDMTSERPVGIANLGATLTLMMVTCLRIEVLSISLARGRTHGIVCVTLGLPDNPPPLS